MTHLGPSPIRTWWFYEMIDIRHRITTDDVVAGALSFFQHRANTLDSFGLNPHAPYTASLDLYHLANACAEAFTMALTTHLAESAEEFGMFRDASRAALRVHGFPRAAHGGLRRRDSICASLEIWGDRFALAAHPHERTLRKSDFALLDSLPRDGMPQVVHCPASHRYFGRAPFRVSQIALHGREPLRRHR